MPRWFLISMSVTAGFIAAMQIVIALMLLAIYHGQQHLEQRFQDKLDNQQEAIIRHINGG